MKLHLTLTPIFLMMVVVAHAQTGEPQAVLAGVDPKPDGSKVTMPMSKLLETEWGMQARPGVATKAAWDYLKSKKLAASPMIVLLRLSLWRLLIPESILGTKA